MMLSKESLDQLESEVRTLALHAAEAQASLDIQTKRDGSPVTQIDLLISTRLIDSISRLFPDCAIISEEETTDQIPEAPYTFVIDPIDGTDVYSQGFPSWCVSIGIIDQKKAPIGALVCAPRFGIATTKGLMVRLDPGGKVHVNGKPFAVTGEKDSLAQLMVGSNAAKMLTLERYPGKIRCYGSTVIHLLCPVLVDKVHGAVQTMGYIWDFVSAHAVLKASGMDIYRADGTPFTYNDAFMDCEPVSEPLYAGTRSGCTQLRKLLALRH